MVHRLQAASVQSSAGQLEGFVPMDSLPRGHLHMSTKCNTETTFKEKPPMPQELSYLYHWGQ